MQMMKRWFAFMLTISLVCSNCSGITVYAQEETVAAEESVSENNGENPVADEPKEYDFNEVYNPSVEEKAQHTEETPSVQDKTSDSITDTPELPSLHIGQLRKEESFPDSEEIEFVYDVPVSFELSDHIILFANYSLLTLPEDGDGTLIWSILRGEKGMAKGSVNLIREEDDWTGYETVSDSPYFTLTQNDDAKSEYYQTAELSAKDTAVLDTFDYYIRAAYYCGTDDNLDETFYAAVTIPFLPLEDIDTNLIQEDAADTAKNDTDSISENNYIAQDTVIEEYPETEPTQDIFPEEVSNKQTHEDTTDTAVPEINRTIQDLSATSENESSTVPQQTKETIGVLTLNKEHVTLHPGDTLSVRATIVPADILAKITWTSSGDDVATVDSTGTITAVSEGTVCITASCNDMSASVNVKVITSGENEVYDLSGDIWIDGFRKESSDLVYTSQKITQNIQVYYKDTLLKEKTDYTLSYKNNINAAAYNSAKAPSVTITLKGQYSGSVTLYYTILPADISKIDIYNPTGDNMSGYTQAVTYSKNLKIPNPVLTFCKKNLTVNKDYVCDYSSLPTDYKKGDSYIAGKVYDYTVNGIGNYTGSVQMHLVIVNDRNLNFSSASVTLGQKQYEYHGTALPKSEITIKNLKINNRILDESLYDFEVYAEAIDGAYIMVYPTSAGEAAGYRGSKKVNLSLTGDRNIANASLGEDWQESIVFSQKTLNEEGGIYQAKTKVLTYTSETNTDTLTEGVDYTVKYSNAQKAGTATVTFTGKGRYKGTLKKKYVITPNTDKSNFTISWKNISGYDNGIPLIAYQKGGVVPEFVLKDQNGIVLTNKTNYTVKLKNNKTPGALMSCEITGKGNYKGYTQTVSLMVMTADISLGTLSVTDKPYSTKKDAWKSKVTIKDINGKTLSAGTDYSKELTYSYEDMSGVPQAGSTVTVTAQGIGCYRDSVISGTYRIYEKNISQLKIVIDTQEYTGEEITLTPSDIHVYATSADQKKGNELAESCYEIIEYKNNIKAGTAKVTLRGTGSYGGTKTYSFKISKKAYQINHVKSITLDKTNLTYSIASENKLVITATIAPQNVANPTVIWSSSDNKIAVVEATDMTEEYGTISIAATINTRKPGNVRITATTQDGNKKAQCQIKIINTPILVEAGQTIAKEVGATYQLHMQFADGESWESNTADIEIESSNTNIVTADKTGQLTMKNPGFAIIRIYSNNRREVQQCYIKVSGGEINLSGDNVLTYKQPVGCTDDTDGINTLLRDAEWSNGKWDTIYIPAGEYHINAESREGFCGFGGLVLTDGQTLIMDPDTKLIAIGNSSENSQVIFAFGRDNIRISGGRIIGERNSHTGSGGEWGHGISIQGCTNVIIENVDISQCWGDGIYLGLYEGWDSAGNRKNFYGSNITIMNCSLHNNRRNNLSITDVDNVTVYKCQFSYAKGTDPQYGIDIEPNLPGSHTCEKITLLDSTFTGNAKASMGIITSAKDITLENCTLDGNFYNMAGKNVVLRNTSIKGEIVDKTGGIKRQ